MPTEAIDGVPIWFDDQGDGPPLVAIHGGILTFELSFGAVLPWLSKGRRIIGVELQGHGHTPDTGRAMQCHPPPTATACRLNEPQTH